MSMHIFTGTPGTTGLLGSESNSSFVVLAQTNITITEYPESLVAGDYLTVNGTLLDDLGQSLEILGVASSAVVHLMVDDVSVASIETDALTGQFSLGLSITRRYYCWSTHHNCRILWRKRLGGPNRSR